RSCRCAPICSDTSSYIKASARTRTASRRKSTFAPVLPSSSSSAIIKLVAMIGTSLRCVLPTRMEPDCGHFCQEGDHILEFTPLPGTITRDHTDTDVIKCKFDAADLSVFDTLTFTIDSAVANGAGLVLVLRSENPNSDGQDYYFMRLTVDWTGPKRFEIDRAALGVAR